MNQGLVTSAQTSPVDLDENFARSWFLRDWDILDWSRGIIATTLLYCRSLFLWKVAHVVGRLSVFLVKVPGVV